MIEILHTVDETGRKLVSVPLGHSGYHARLYEEDYGLLVRLGVSPYWKLVGGQVVTAGRKDLSIARILMDAGKGTKVQYIDRDSTNLLRDNLCLAKGGGISRTRGKITRQNLLNRPEIKHVYKGEGSKTSTPVAYEASRAG